MKTTLKYLTIVGAAIAALTWLTVKVTSTEPESEGESDRGDVPAREAFRRLQLQDENGEIPPNALIDAYKQKKDMPFLPEAWAELTQAMSEQRKAVSLETSISITQECWSTVMRTSIPMQALGFRLDQTITAV